MKKKLLCALGILGLLCSRITIKVTNVTETEPTTEAKMETIKLNVDVIKAYREVVDLAFEAYGDWAVGDFPELKKRLTRIWKTLEVIDSERRNEIAKVRLAEKEKKETYEGTFK
jgi:hypothetical protein